ncbi:MAG: hypothetical protein PSN04_01010 [Methyloprofundus sp.]|nr:hypothetical protein [Methyloprofundus sp.]
MLPKQENTMESRYDNLNPNDFTQKDLMLHLLQVAQHSATREDVKDDIGKLDRKFDELYTKVDKVESKLDAKIDQLESKLDAKFDQLESRLNAKFDKVDGRIDKIDGRIDKIDGRIDKIDAKFDRLQWLIIAAIILSFLKENILALF